MIKIISNRKDNKIFGDFIIRGDDETLTAEIYAILATFTKECPEPFDHAVSRHLRDLMEEE